MQIAGGVRKGRQKQDSDTYKKGACLRQAPEKMNNDKYHLTTILWHTDLSEVLTRTK